MDMNFIFSWSTRYLTSERSERVRYRVDHSKIKFISTRGHVISSISLATIIVVVGVVVIIIVVVVVDAIGAVVVVVVVVVNVLVSKAKSHSQNILIHSSELPTHDTIYEGVDGTTQIC